MAGRRNFNPLRSSRFLERLGHMLELGWLFEVAPLWLLKKDLQWAKCFYGNIICYFKLTALKGFYEA